MAVATTSPLTGHQHSAFKTVRERLSDGKRFTGLRGYAGTGKTFVVGHLVDRLAEEDVSVTVCAPTHKAVQVMSEEIENDEVATRTLHSFLGLQLQPQQDGAYELVDEEERQFSKGVVIVDEASMIGQKEWAFIESTPFWLQWVFVGDPAQLPPVNEDPSPALEIPGPKLEKVHRQAEGNPIVNLATDVRDRSGGRFESDFQNGKGVGITKNRESFLGSLLQAFSDRSFDEDVTFARVLAYRNDTVGWYNQRIRKALHGEDAPRFVPGEWIVAGETWYNESERQITNSEEVSVEEAGIETYTAPDQREWTVWDLEVSSAREGQSRTLKVLHEEEWDRYQSALKRRKEKAQEDPSKWDRYYDLREQFARVDYAYATTVHKAQGSTYDTVFVDYRDLRQCNGPEKNALLYVAVTRPSRRLGLLA